MPSIHPGSTPEFRVAGGSALRRLLALAGATLLVSTGSMPASAAQGFLNCASNGYKYNYCSADTQGRVVMVREVSSGNLCRQGRG